MKEAALISERIRRDIEQSTFSTFTGTIKITASFGVAEAFRRSTSLEELLSEADHALYSSKRNGRNSVHLYGVSSITRFKPM